MFFIKAGSVIAWLFVAAGAVKVVLGFFIAFGISNAEEYAAASKRYLGTSTSGEAIDKGLIWLATGVVIGLIVQIAKNHDSK